MKVQVKEGKEVKEFDLIKSWSDVTLETWLKLVDFESKTKSEQAQVTIETLSNIPHTVINKLELSDVGAIMSAIGRLQKDQNKILKRIIEIEGKEYGFHPDLDSITLGEYADLETFIKQGIEGNLPEVMAILYRPIVDKKGDLYRIEPYDGNLKMRAEEMKKMSAEQVQSAMVFFWIFVHELLMILPSSLMQQLKGMTTQN
tara:strand:- start:2631 stop:3233 length:603 start_codon:yes stop_codon:yes gene_type:complete